MRKQVAWNYFISAVFCVHCVFIHATAYAVGFELQKPGSQDEQSYGDTTIYGDATTRHAPKKIARVLEFFTPLNEARNYYEMADVLDTNLVMLDNGEIVRLMGLSSGAEIEAYDDLYLPGRHMADSDRKVIENFMRAYLENKKLKVKRDEFIKTDENGHPYVYLSVVGEEPFNEILLRYGYGLLSTAAYFSLYDTYQRYQYRAQKKRLGIWR